MGGKAAALASLAAADLPVPQFCVLTPDAFHASLTPSQSAEWSEGRVPSEPTLRSDFLEAVLGEVRTWQSDGPLLLAVRSSGVDEDSADHTFAGQFDSFLFVPLDSLVEKIREVWLSGFGERVLAYRKEHGLAGSDGRTLPNAPAVLIQQMVDADVAGVAFSADPISGRRSVAVVSAVYGLGTALVGGDADADTFRVDDLGSIFERQIAEKTTAHRAAPGTREGVDVQSVAADLALEPALNADQVLAVAALARRADKHFGRPQDIEWAIRGGQLFLLQSRPVTSLRNVVDPDGLRLLWDNSNIVESYSGITTPLTFTFALGAYEGVYREFCRILGVPEARIEANDRVFARMLGIIRGRVYYNLLNWYRVLALLPGFTVNRKFMEGMMGVREGLPDEVAMELAQNGVSGLRDRIDLIRAIAGLVANQWKLPAKTRAFYARLDDALSSGAKPLEHMRLDELVAEYRQLEEKLLTRWDAPLINDFFAMIAFGVLGRLTTRWCGDENGTLQNDLVSAQGGMISAEPAKRIQEMAGIIAESDAEVRESVGTRLRTGTLAEARRAIAELPPLETKYEEYLERFGDRCLDELKLESSTLLDDPTPLYRSIGNTAARLERQSLAGSSNTSSAGPPSVDSSASTGSAGEGTAVAGTNAAATPEPLSPARAAEAKVATALRANPFRRILFSWVLRNARDRVRDRENLRFERTRLFGRVRRIFLETGKRLWAEGKLDTPRDVFYLEVSEILGFVEGTSPSDDLGSVARVRKERFAQYAELPAPADRFETLGAVYIANDFRERLDSTRGGSMAHADASDNQGSSDSGSSTGGDSPTASDPTCLHGLGCCPGIVRGPVRVVRDPRQAVLQDGEILVAERTDPGWILLFPAAAAILVERGSLLSHSAIVAREMGIPAIVSIRGVTSELETGDWVEMNGSTGEIRRISEAER